MFDLLRFQQLRRRPGAPILLLGDQLLLRSFLKATLLSLRLK
jgi:hypothetical protein